MSGAKDIIFNTCTFDDGSTYAISVQGCSFFKFLSCNFLGSSAAGISTATSACNNYTIMSCTFRDNVVGVECHASDDWIKIILNDFIGDTLDDHYTSKGLVEKNIGDDI